LSSSVCKYFQIQHPHKDEIYHLPSNFQFLFFFSYSGNQVSPDLYGDNNTRLFTYWTVSFQFQHQNFVPSSNYLSISYSLHSIVPLPWQSDAYQATGCYNLLCSGFIQINSDIALGATISPLSKYSSSQYDITILVWKVHFLYLFINYLLILDILAWKYAQHLTNTTISILRPLFCADHTS